MNSALKQFREEVPTLGLLGEQYFILSEKPYSVDNDVQLVCKYLQAYDTGGIIGIDRLYCECAQGVARILGKEVHAIILFTPVFSRTAPKFGLPKATPLI